jgi:hypothetical protein
MSDIKPSLNLGKYNSVTLGTFAELRILTSSFVMPDCPSVLNNLAHTGRIFVEICAGDFH